MAGTTRTLKNRVTERLIRIHPTNHTLIRCVNGDSVKDSRNLPSRSLTDQAARRWGRSARLSMARWHQTFSGDARSSETQNMSCLLYTSDAADDLLCVDLGGR